MKRIVVLFVFVQAAFFAGSVFGGQKTEMLEVKPVVVGKEFSEKDVLVAINLAAKVNGWRRLKMDYDPVLKIKYLYIFKDRFEAQVEVTFVQNEIRFSYLDSNDLGFTEKGDKRSIHPYYNEWLTALRQRIEANVLAGKAANFDARLKDVVSEDKATHSFIRFTSDLMGKEAVAAIYPSMDDCGNSGTFYQINDDPGYIAVEAGKDFVFAVGYYEPRSSCAVVAHFKPEAGARYQLHGSITPIRRRSGCSFDYLTDAVIKPEIEQLEVKAGFLLIPQLQSCKPKK